jgi:hypothetical protein
MRQLACFEQALPHSASSRFRFPFNSSNLSIQSTSSMFDILETVAVGRFAAAAAIVAAAAAAAAAAASSASASALACFDCNKMG